jgi:hypothetical protein
MMAGLVGSLIVVAAFAVSNAGATSTTTSTSRSQREAVVFVTDLSTGLTGLDKGFYQAIGLADSAVSWAALAPNYNVVTTVQNGSATLTGLVNALRTATSHPNTTAVDLIFSTHGANHAMVFADGTHSSATVASAIVNGLTPAERAKLRIVYSTACFGASHRGDWLTAGFKAASGAVGIHADALTSFPAFLASWVAGANFSTAVDASNGADPLHVSDNLAKAYYTLQGRPDLAAQVNSFRLKSGNTALSIGAMS